MRHAIEKGLFIGLVGMSLHHAWLSQYLAAQYWVMLAAMCELDDFFRK